MKRYLQRGIMFIAAVALLGAATRMMAIQPYHPNFLDTGRLPGGKALGYMTDNQFQFSAVVGVVNDGTRDHPALWGSSGGNWSLLRLSEMPGGGGSANAVTIVGSGTQRRVVVVGFLDSIQDRFAALWIVNPRNGNQAVRMLDGPGTEAHGIMGSIPRSNSRTPDSPAS